MIISRHSVLINVLLPLALGIGMLYGYLHFCRAANEIGLGKGTSFYMPVDKSYPIHITSLDTAERMRQGWQERGSRKLSLWFGNSQLNGINQYKPGEKNCTAFIFDSLKRYDQELLGVSFPNGNMQEFLTAVIYLSNKFQVKNIILPLFYDDMREDGIRADINTLTVGDFLRGQRAIYPYYKDIPSLELIKNAPSAFKSINKDRKAPDQTLQEVSEKFLDDGLNAGWNIWNNRANFRANIFNDVYRCRNFILGIKATTIRKMIYGRYISNFNSFKDITRYCSDRGISLYIYIPPIRNDIPPPYDIGGYNGFKEGVRQECVKNKATFLNLENIVPAKYWGKKGTTTFGVGEEIDFMHFQEPGHHLIADTILTILVNNLH